MNIYFLSVSISVSVFLAVFPVEAHFRHFHAYSPRVPYYQRPEWIQYHTLERDIVIDIEQPKCQDDVQYLLQRLEETNKKIKIVKEKLNFPGIMSLKYRHGLEKELLYLNKERDQIQQHLKEFSYTSTGPKIEIDPFIAYPLYSNGGYRHHYPVFRKIHP